ncbi:ROK family protein [Vibrio aquaticus]|uniref:ROK family protein n=1 Tax=Vibrio aquaticus TaxID=2496559 RepID=A0A3S0N7Y8_9VIBR|nr:N-acetylmannosamine kinase [Vibrio aquaticus]RTZ18015.1 ROK family protein [Vibrio aquaticus]
MRTLAIDIGGTKIALGIVENDELIERVQIPTPQAESADQFAQAILASAAQWLANVDNIGVSTTGLVTKEGISAINPDTLAFPSPFPLGQVLETLTNKPVSMLNDAQAASWYEFIKLDTAVKNMAFITVSTGVGGGIIIGGKLHSGQSGLAGHVGHISIDSQGPICGCGQTGCVEAIASGTAIKKASDAEFTSPINNIELFEQADVNPKAETIILRSADAIATLCCTLKATLDLDVVVLGGGVGLARGYLDRVKIAIQSRPDAFQVPVIEAVGNYDACLLGAAYQFKE